MDDCSKDFLSALPFSLFDQIILSKVSIKDVGSTSLLSKRWRRYLFANLPDLDFNDSSSLQPQDTTGFVSFVDRVLELRGNNYVNKFSLKCGEHVWGSEVSSWILKVLSLGVLDLALHLSPKIYDPLPSEIFVHKELISLKIGPEGGPSFELEDVSLPNLKTLDLESFTFEEDEMGFAKLLTGCPVLEELALSNLCWNDWDSCYVSSNTLKRLMLFTASNSDKNPKSVSFDTPNVAYFAYSDNIAYKYPVLNFDSLVEAQIDIKMTYNQRGYFSELDSDEEIGMFSDTKVLLMGICNVKTLYISYKTLETLNFCCEAIPIFDNLTHLTINSHNPLVGWKSLPKLLKNSPNLETLVFQGLNHRFTDECGDVCVCRRSEKNHSSLSQCPVRFLTVSYLGVPYDSDDDEWEMKTKMKNIKHFLKKMPNLEQLIISYNSPSGDHDLAEVKKQLQKLDEVASTECDIQVIFDDISFSYVVPNSLSMELGQLLL